MSDYSRKELMAGVRSVVVKIGTNVLTNDRGSIDAALIAQVAEGLAALRQRGLQVTVVSSGAIGTGMDILGLRKRPDELPPLQACAAVGQAHLIQTFDQALNKHGYHAAQILITRDDFEDRARYLNIRHCIHALQEFGAVPVLNENDTVSVDEIRYGYNDIIAALVANNLRANLLVLLTSVEGLCRDAARGDVIDTVARLDEELLQLVDGTRSSRGSGGMGSKLEAVRMVVQAGETAVIASGRRKNVLVDLLDGKSVGTVFFPAPSKMNSRERWIAFTARPRGRLTIDEGAVRAVVDKGKSLLASGIVEVSGEFQAGDVVSVVGPGGAEIARGLTNYDAAALRTIRGRKTTEFKKLLGEKPYDEVLHRDNMALKK
jgi:glutamate 5-kinase